LSRNAQNDFTEEKGGRREDKAIANTVQMISRITLFETPPGGRKSLPEMKDIES